MSPPRARGALLLALPLLVAGPALAQPRPTLGIEDRVGGRAGGAAPRGTPPQLVLDLEWEPDAGRGFWGTLFRGAPREAEHTFFDLPFPLDARRHPHGAPDLSGLPAPRRTRYLPFAGQRRFVRRAYRMAQRDTRGFSPSSPIYLRFDGPLRPPVDDPLASVAPDAKVFVVRLDPGTSDYLARQPVHVSLTATADSMRPAHLLQVLPVPGLALRPDATYACVVRRDLGAADGRRLGQPTALAALLRGDAPPGAWGARLAAAYAPLVRALPDLGLAVDEVAAATVFTTGDPARRLTEQVRHVASLPPPGVRALRRQDDLDSPVFTALEGTYRVPQYQEGVAPYLVGSFVGPRVSRLGVGRVRVGRLLGDGSQRLDDRGRPVTVRTAKTRFELSIPKGRMPAAGFPLYFYVHGTGGDPAEAIDRGREVVRGEPTPGQGYALTVGQAGWATACVATGFSPERIGLRAADGYLAYNFLNPVAMRDNFLQMVLELVHFRNLLRDLRIDPALCPGTDASAAPDGRIRFDFDRVVIAGQSLGSYLSGMLAATLPGFRAAVLTGAGGSWIEFPFGPKHPFDLGRVVAGLTLPRGETLDRFHPVIMAFDLALGPADNAHFWRLIAREPLPGHAPLDVLVVEGEEDLQTALNTQRALVLGIGADLAGADAGATPAEQLLPVLPWGGLRQLPFPVQGNLLAADGSRRTVAVVRYPADTVGSRDGHHVAFQYDAPKRQVVAVLEAIEAGRRPAVIDGDRP